MIYHTVHDKNTFGIVIAVWSHDKIHFCGTKFVKIKGVIIRTRYY
jgi:hypothetical protein